MLEEAKEGGEGLAGVDAADGVGEEGGEGLDADFGVVFVVVDAIGGDEFGDFFAVEAFDGRGEEDGVADGEVDGGFGTSFDEGRDLVEDAAAGDHVIDEDGGFAFDIADDGGGFGFGEADATFVDNGEREAELVGVLAGEASAADIGRDDDGFVTGEAGLVLLEVVGEDGEGGERIGGDIEKALDLEGVDVDIEDAVNAHGFEHGGDDAGAEGFTAVGHAVLAGVGVVGDDGGDAFGRGTAAGIDEEDKFHKMVVDGGGTGLDDVHFLFAEEGIDLDMYFAIGEMGDRNGSELSVKIVADFLGEDRIGGASNET